MSLTDSTEKPMAGRDGWLPASLYGYCQCEALVLGMFADLVIEDTGEVVRAQWRHGPYGSIAWWPAVPDPQRPDRGFGSCDVVLIRRVRQ